jgi:hypothetical protein
MPKELVDARQWAGIATRPAFVGNAHSNTASSIKR